MSNQLEISESECTELKIQTQLNHKTITIKWIILMIGFLALGLTACKKDKLVGKYEILEGSWSLGYIVERTYGQVSGTTFDTLFPASIDNTYRLEFLSKGILKQYTDGELVGKYRIVFENFGSPSSSDYDFVADISLNNGPDESLFLGVTQNEMSTSRGHISDEYVSYTNGNFKISYEIIYFRD